MKISSTKVNLTKIKSLLNTIAGYEKYGILNCMPEIKFWPTIHLQYQFSPPTFGILEWTKEEIEHIDIKTRKLLCLTGNFHRNSNVDRLYVPRQAGGRGMNSILDVFVVRLIATAIHIENISKKHKYLHEVK